MIEFLNSAKKKHKIRGYNFMVLYEIAYFSIGKNKKYATLDDGSYLDIKYLSDVTFNVDNFVKNVIDELKKLNLITVKEGVKCSHYAGSLDDRYGIKI